MIKTTAICYLPRYIAMIQYTIHNSKKLDELGAVCTTYGQNSLWFISNNNQLKINHKDHINFPEKNISKIFSYNVLF